MLQRLRSVLVRPGREKLSGVVEVDETYVGGVEAGLRGGRAVDKKVLVGIAVEVGEDGGLGRCRLGLLPNASAASLQPFVVDHVGVGSRVITDAWTGYRSLGSLGFIHEARSQQAARARGDGAASLLPAVHQTASLLKRWLMGTHRGAVSTEHLQAYADEFVFRFNRRAPSSRGMLFYRLLALAES